VTDLHPRLQIPHCRLGRRLRAKMDPCPPMAGDRALAPRRQTRSNKLVVRLSAYLDLKVAEGEQKNNYSALVTVGRPNYAHPSSGPA
jgi:hypothetical protein